MYHCSSIFLRPSGVSDVCGETGGGCVRSVFSKGECESCGTEVGEPARELIKGRYQNRFAPGNGTLAERVEGFT